MSEDLYQVLGIRRNASAKTIKKAHRRKAMETHPDRGGDPEEFARVQQAARILCDDVLKAKYDTTGEIEAEIQKPIHIHSLAILFQHLQTVLQSLINAQRLPLQSDVLGMMRDRIREKIIEVDKSIKNVTSLKERLEAIKERFHVKTGENHLSSMIQVQVDQFTKAIEEMNNEKSIQAYALEMLKNYEYTFDKPQAKQNAFDLKSIIMQGMGSSTSQR